MLKHQLGEDGEAEMNEPVLNIRDAVQAEIKKQFENLFGNELTGSARDLIISCPHLINRLAASLDRTFEILSKNDSVLEPISIQPVWCSPEIMGYNDTK